MTATRRNGNYADQAQNRNWRSGDPLRAIAEHAAEPQHAAVVSSSEAQKKRLATRAAAIDNPSEFRDMLPAW
jgi:hypothetical protein